VLVLLLLSRTSTLDDFVLNFLHELQELIESDPAARVWVNVFDEISNLVRITLKTAHYCLEILHFDVATLLLVKEVEDLLQVLDLLISEFVVVGLLVFVLLDFVLFIEFFMWLSSREGRLSLLSKHSLIFLLLELIW